MKKGNDFKKLTTADELKDENESPSGGGREFQGMNGDLLKKLLIKSFSKA